MEEASNTVRQQSVFVVAAGFERETQALEKELGLTFVRVSIHPDQQKIVFKDDRDQEIVCTLIRRTSVMTEVKVDVSLFGPNDFSRLMLDHILANVHPQGSSTTRPGAGPQQNG